MRHGNRLAVLVLVAAVVPFAGGPVPADETAATAPRFRLVLVDGAATIAVGPVERRDGVLRFRTPEGVLASVREDRVTALEDAPSPSASPSRRDVASDPGAPVPVIDNDDLPTAPPSGVVVPAGVPDPAPAEPPATLPIPTYDTYRDRDGRDEAWWRSKVAAIDVDRARAETDRDRWNRRFAEVSALVRIECAGERRNSTSVRSRCAELLGIQEEARREVEDAEARLEDAVARKRALSDEARRAGALPGWLR